MHLGKERIELVKLDREGRRKQEVGDKKREEVVQC